MERKEVPRFFFSREEQEQIKRAVAEAESKTSAEIVVRMERNCPGDPLVHCRDLLQTLGITQTKSRTGVILYFSLEDHKVAVFGDVSVDRVMTQQHWDSLCSKLVKGFQEEKPCEAVCDAVRWIGERLSGPLRRPKDDVNELPDDLSSG
jgi:uncharacterized membrane protein